jgi:hypothetical protein
MAAKLTRLTLKIAQKAVPVAVLSPGIQASSLETFGYTLVNK